MLALASAGAAAPADRPPRVAGALRAAERIDQKPYVWGGGHGGLPDPRGYDCSGAVSYVLRGGGWLRRPRVASDFMHFGRRGRGRFITIYAKATHVYMVIEGRRFDTSGSPSGPRFRRSHRVRDGFRARHPLGY